MRQAKRSPRSSQSQASLALSLLALAACGKSNGFVDVVTVNRPDSGAAAADGGKEPRDSGFDAMVADSGTPGTADAGYGDAGRGDAASTVDAAATDGASSEPQDDAGPSERCQLADDNDEFSEAVQFTDEGGFVLTPGITGFGAAFHAFVNDCDALATLPVGATGQFPSPQRMFGDCQVLVQDVSLLHVSDGFRMTWVDTSAGTAELQTLVLPDTLSLESAPSPTRLTNNTTVLEQKPVLAALSGGSYLAWIARDTVTKKNALWLQTADASSNASNIVAADDGYLPARIALAQLGKDRGLLAFVSEQLKPGVWIVPLDTQAKATSKPVLLSALVSAGNTVDITTRDDGGAIVYSVDVGTSHEVRFQRLDIKGAPVSDEIKLISGALQARDAAISRLGDGYAVVFRSLPTDTQPQSEIRLAFITKEGTAQRDSVGRLITYHVADASTGGGRVSVRISVDGQLAIAFLDGTANGPRLRVIRKRLDCAL